MLAPIIIYEDNHLLIVQKPPGMLSQPDGGPRPDLIFWAGEYLRRDKPGRAFVGLVHRLDYSVGGVMALAKTSKAASRLSGQFRERGCEKIYLALVSGKVPADEGRLDNSLMRAGTVTRAAARGEKGKDCSLIWRVREKYSRGRAGGLTLLEINLLTGFKHQIRAQLALQSWPVAGDVKYKSPVQSSGLAIGLWAESLSFDHPTKITRPADNEAAAAGGSIFKGLKERMTFKAEPIDVWPWSLICRLK